ncbi:thioredoxin family protein [Endothiovibrio diazotrophicus]
MTQHVAIIEVDEGNFADAVVAASHQKPVLVDFSAEWCAPCRAIEPVMHKIADEMGERLTVAKVDADENMKLCGHYRLRGFPTVLLFQNGEEKGRFAGFKPTPQVKEFVEQHLD